MARLRPSRRTPRSKRPKRPQQASRHTYREGEYECTLHESQCFARHQRNRNRCGSATILHPLCPHHAHEGLGVAVRRSTILQARCGLFATRTFQPGDLIAPYLGIRRPSRDMRCKMAVRQGSRPRVDSPYSMDMDDLGNWVVDTSCYRSYASMVNHHQAASRRNCKFFWVKLDRHRDFRRPDPSDPRNRSLLSLRGYRSAPRILCDADRPKEAGLNENTAWLIATKKIPVGTEMFTDYGKRARQILAINHDTDPPLC